ncbi:hypothetical protein Nepgr_000883 [Nepenthes gracilis]|uniref:Uncharacterized protein n=1 Tax=Nepenthes gracilis TaxID=150966 RepID=A0AAD3RWJ1_NEPGR|nr:hypothetical protein Nepgr_000883 [Nepenthes gracilis]
MNGGRSSGICLNCLGRAQNARDWYSLLRPTSSAVLRGEKTRHSLFDRWLALLMEINVSLGFYFVGLILLK